MRIEHARMALGGSPGNAVLGQDSSSIPLFRMVSTRIVVKE
jgi:hypothetical protein